VTNGFFLNKILISKFWRNLTKKKLAKLVKFTLKKQKKFPKKIPFRKKKNLKENKELDEIF
jgi:hypothetical protein